MNTVDHSNTAAAGSVVARGGSPVLLVLLLAFACVAGGCADYYYTGQPDYYRSAYAYSPGPGYVRPGYGYPGYGYSGYGYPGSISIAIGDRPYYTRGPGYYVGRSYYVWRPGHWVRRHGERVWVHGRYVVR